MSEHKKINRDDLPDILESIARQIRERAKKWPGGRALTQWEFVRLRVNPGDHIFTDMLEISVFLDAESEIDLCRDAIRVLDPDAVKQPADDFLTKEIHYTNGHKCVPNGVGDYTFICPTTGEKPGFVPFMLAHILEGQCVCGEQIKRCD